MENMNFLNSLSYFSQNNPDEKKEVKTGFMHKINRKPIDNKFVNLSKYVTQHLLHFFDYDELYE